MNEVVIVDSHTFEKFFYFSGAALALVWKFVRYRYDPRNRLRPWRDVGYEWMFDPSSENASSWLLGTMAMVWVLGAVYIDRIDWIIGTGYLNQIPIHASIAFLLGVLMEFIAPPLAKWVVGKVTA